MAQQGKASATKPNDLSLVPGIHIVEGENTTHASPPMHGMSFCVYVSMHTDKS